MKRQFRVALFGNPNCGKSSLFNAMTNGRQKVANYPGVTVECKEAVVDLPNGDQILFFDLPGTYSLESKSLDEKIAHSFLHEKSVGKKLDAILSVVNITKLALNLRLVLELKEFGIPIVLAANMIDLAEKRGAVIDFDSLSSELRVPVVATSAVTRSGLSDLFSQISATCRLGSTNPASDLKSIASINVFHEVDRILNQCQKTAAKPAEWTEKIDSILLHKWWGPLTMLAVFAVVFQSIFSLAAVPQGWIEDGLAAAGIWTARFLPTGMLQSLLVDGVIGGVGSVLVFLPQILILFFFILVLEDSGYMARAAFLCDRLMVSVGLTGRSFIPLLSSYACAIPGIISARTIPNARDRLVTIMIAPLTTCSARLPVYALLIAAFVPNIVVWKFFKLQGVVLFALYALGFATALLVAKLFKLAERKTDDSVFFMELPTYKLPNPFDIFVGLLQRAKMFLTRAGTTIFAIAIVVWFLTTFPLPDDSNVPAIAQTFAGKLGSMLEPIVRPLGFNWHIAVALIPGFAAREVLVATLGSLYSVESTGDAVVSLSQRIQTSWSWQTGVSLLVFYAYAPLCLSTFAVIKREISSWKWTIVTFCYLILLAYFAAMFVYFLTTKWGHA